MRSGRALVAVTAAAGAARLAACTSFSGSAEPSAADAAPPVQEGGPSIRDGAGGDATPTTTSRYAQAVLADRPIAYWRMRVAPGASTVADETGGGNDLVLVGGWRGDVAGPLAGEDDTAVSFDGRTGSAQAVNPRAFDFAALAPFTVEMWARREEVDGGFTFRGLVESVAGAGGSSTGYMIYVYAADGGTPGTYFEYRAPPGAPVNLRSSLIALSTWTHVAVTFDGSNVATFIDGAAEHVGNIDAGFGPRTTPFTLAKSSIYQSDYFAGAIDELAMYGHALSSEDVLRHVKIARGQ